MCAHRRPARLGWWGGRGDWGRHGRCDGRGDRGGHGRAGSAEEGDDGFVRRIVDSRRVVAGEAAPNDSRRSKLSRLLRSHRVGDDSVARAHEDEGAHAAPRALCLDALHEAQVRGRQVAAEEDSDLERASRHSREVHGREGGALRVAEDAIEGALGPNDLVQDAD